MEGSANVITLRGQSGHLSGRKKYAQFSDSPPQGRLPGYLIGGCFALIGLGSNLGPAGHPGELKCLHGKQCPSLPLLSPPLPPPITAEHQDGIIAAPCCTQAHIPSHEEALSVFRV